MFLPLELTLRSSRIYALVMVAVHILALLGVWLAALGVLAKVLMTGVLMANMIWSWHQNSSCQGAMRVTQSGQLEIWAGKWRVAEIRGGPSCCHGW